MGRNRSLSKEKLLDEKYIHGPQNCRLCFSQIDGDELRIGPWRLINNPGYYGSAIPSILVLGFSKGANQDRVSQIGNFDQIAFANSRHRLRQVLEILNLMPGNREIDSLMTKHERDFGIASIVRCSLSMMKGGKWRTSGDLISSAFTTHSIHQIISRCVKEHLLDLPESVKLVILLGNSDNYVKRTYALFRQPISEFIL